MLAPGLHLGAVAAQGGAVKRVATKRQVAAAAMADDLDRLNAVGAFQCRTDGVQAGLVGVDQPHQDLAWQVGEKPLVIAHPGVNDEQGVWRRCRSGVCFGGTECRRIVWGSAVTLRNIKVGAEHVVAGSHGTSGIEHHSGLKGQRAAARAKEGAVPEHGVTQVNPAKTRRSTRFMA